MVFYAVILRNLTRVLKMCGVQKILLFYFPTVSSLAALQTGSGPSDCFMFLKDASLPHTSQSNSSQHFEHSEYECVFLRKVKKVLL